MKWKWIITGMLLIGFTFSCKSYQYGAGEENVQKSNLTMGVVKSKIEKGTTTQEEILKIFGSPNIITKNRTDNEVWSYNKMSVARKEGETFFVFGQKASSSTTNQSFDLIIIFNEEDVVIDYSVISTAF